MLAVGEESFVFQFAIRYIKIKIYGITIIPVILFRSEIWLLTLREVSRLSIFEKRFQRGIFGPKKDEVTGEWRTLRNEELNDLHSSSDVIRMMKSRGMRWARHVARMGRLEVRTWFRW
jgi:hypothetical protein